MRVLVVAGARPNFMKVAPILRELTARGHDPLLVHTGQHYDARMSDAFFQDLGLPEPAFHLGVGGGSHAQQTARIMEAFERVHLDARADWLVVVGDVNSTIATALVAAKLKEETGTRICHVEAGLRSHDWRMPEEVNRVLTDRLSDLLLTPSADAHDNLASEGIPAERVEFVGNVMIDTLHSQLDKARQLALCTSMGLTPKSFVLSTLHRPSNVDDAAALKAILEGLQLVRRDMPIVLPLHPRTRRSVVQFGMERLLDRFITVDPLGYTEMLSLTDSAATVLTDSGGLQEETTVLGVPCVTLRETTERPATIVQGTNRLVPWPLSPAGIYDSFRTATREPPGQSKRIPPGWDGFAARRICDALENRQPRGA